MDEVYLINELRASFLKYSNEISKTRVIDPYQTNVNDSAIHKLYIDHKSGKDYYKLMKSPSINDDYFNIIANEDNESPVSSLNNHFLKGFHSPKDHEVTAKFYQNNELKTPKSHLKPAEDKILSSKTSLLSFGTNNDQHSNTSKITAKTSKSKLRLSMLSGLFHKHNLSENDNPLNHKNVNVQNNKLFKTRSKSASLFSKDFDVSSKNSITHSESRKSSDILRRGVGSLYRKISNSSAQSFSSNENGNFNNDDKYYSKTTSLLKKGKKLFHFKHNNSSNKTNYGLSSKTPKSELGKNYSTQVLEDMMYTDQLFREGEIPDNFDDSEEDDDDYDINRSNRSSLSIQKNSFYQRSFGKSAGKKYESGDFALMLHTDKAEKKVVGNNESLSQIGSSNKKNIFSTKEGALKNKTTEVSSTSLQKDSNHDISEDTMFNFKKISKKILPLANNNNVTDKSNDGNTSVDFSLSEDSLLNVENFGSQKRGVSLVYPKESVEIDSYLEDGQNLDKVLNFDRFPSNSNPTSSKNSLSSVVNQPLDKQKSNNEEAERYYGDLASSFGESLMDDDYEDDALASVENSVPLKNKGFLLTNNDKKSFESSFSFHENYNEYTDFIADKDMIDYFAKETDINTKDDAKASNLTTNLKPNTANTVKFQLNGPTTNYEDIIDDLNGIELTCYLKGKSEPIELKISMAKKVTNFQLLQLILYKYNLEDDIDNYMLRIVDEDGLPFEGTFGILNRDDLVERSLMMEELVACKIEDDPKQVELNKEQRLKNSNKDISEQETIINPVKHEKRILIINSNPNSFNSHVPAMNIETKDLDTIGEVVTRFCLYNDVDPKKYYLRVQSDNKYYLPSEITLKYFFNTIYNTSDKYEIISIRESRQINLRKLKYDIKENEKQESIHEEATEGKEHINGLTPFTLNHNGDYLPVSSHNLGSEQKLDSKAKQKLDEENLERNGQKQKKFLDSLQKQPKKPYNNGVPLNLNEIYYRYTVFRRQHQKVSLLTNKQLKTLMIDGDFIYLVDCDFNTAPMMTENEFKADNSVYGFGGNNSVWDSQQFLKSKANTGVNDDNIPTTKTFHVSQIIQIEKSLKNSTHFKIKFVRSHGPKWYYFETLSSSDRNEIITKLSMLKAIYNRNK
ncbi:hypothetical protein FOG50_00978 [Hanseniaspora uvarum]|nr:hypothetical protein FOG50_00978 [Hanseniaspora uvarum]